VEVAIVEGNVLPDGPTTRGATTSWWVYRSWQMMGTGPPGGRDHHLLTSGRAVTVFITMVCERPLRA